MKGKTTFIVASSTIFLLFAIVVFAPNFGDPSPDLGTPDNGTIVNWTAGSNYIDGNFTNMQADDNAYFSVGRNNTAGVSDDLNAFINITYNITPLGLNTSQIQQLIFNISYCNSRDITQPSTCGGGLAQGTARTMNVQVYNWSSGAYVNIGTISETNNKDNATYHVNGSFSNFVSNGIINVRYETNYTFGSGNQDAVFSIDYAPLTVKYDNITPNVTLDRFLNGYNTTFNNLTVNFTVTDNNATIGCSVIVNNAVNQTNSSMQNNTGTSFNIPGLVHGYYNWSVNCTDIANTGSSVTRLFFVNRTPTLVSINDTPDPIKGGNVITINSSGIDDPNNDTVNFYCASTSAPTAANTLCTGGSTTDTSPPYSLNCTFVTAATDLSNTVFCSVYDGESYATTLNTTYTTDSTQPTTTIANVSNDAAAVYFDRINDGTTNITVNGEASMQCRFSTSDLAYSSMSNDCTITSTQALCQATTISQTNYTIYVSCRDSLANEQNSTTNLEVPFTLDYTAPNTTDDASSAVQQLGYNVTISENDNIDGDPSTLYCVDTANTCAPNTIIDAGGKVQFNSRGTYYLRYNSTDDAGNQQTTVSKTVTINSLPTFTSATDNGTTIKGGSLLNVSTVSIDSNSQTITLWVCSSNSANSSGCASTYCSANATENASCTFSVESDNTEHTWYAFIFDSLNESATANSRSGTYTTDSTPASATVSSPANTTLSQNSTTAEIVLNEAGDNASYCLDVCSSNTTMTKLSSTLFTSAIVNLTNGAHTLTFYFNDTVGNLDNATRSFTVDTTLNDTTAPVITVRSPINGTYFNTSSITLNVTTDEVLSIAQYLLNATSYQNLLNHSGTQWNTTVTLAEGIHNISFRANDTSGNRNTGNTSLIFFFVDMTAPQNGTIGVLSGANITCFSSWTDNIRLDYGFVEYNISGSFVNSTNITFNGTSGDLNFTFAPNATLGTVGCRFYMFDKVANVTRTSIVSGTINDTTVPRLENTTYVPNTTALLDPNAVVNLTINATDGRGISNVTVQYRLLNESSYTTFLMTGAGGTGYNASITFGEGNWTFKFNATDTSDNMNATQEINLSVFNDDTFVNITTIPVIKSFTLSERANNSFLGNLTLNNTADYNLNFTITVTSVSSRVTLNTTSNTTFMIPVPRGNVTTISLEANTTNLSVGLYNYSVYIEVRRNPVVGTENITMQINIQNLAGPVVDASIDTYSANTTLGQTIDLVSSVTNFGTSDATGVYLVWTLPENWMLVSGNTTRNIGTLSPGIKATNTIRATIGGTNGTFTINATANSTEGSTDVDSKNVGVGTPITVTQTETISVPGPAGGGGGGAGVNIFTINLQYPSFIAVSKKETAVFAVNVTNPNRLTKLVNTTLTIDGYSSVLVSISPEKMDIGFNKTDQFIVEIRAPTYIEAKEYTLTLRAKAKAVTSSISNPVERTATMSFVIHSINESSAKENVIDALKIVNDLNSQGIESKLIASYIDEAKNALANGDYEGANELVIKIKETRRKLSEAKDLLNQVETKINEADFNGLRIEETNKLYQLALSAFQREDYDRAIDRARSALSTYPLETRGKLNYIKTVQNFWWAFLAASIALTYASFLSYRKLTLYMIGKRLISLRREEISLRELIDNLKNEYFVKKSLGRTEYHKSIYEYETRTAKVKKNIIRYMSKRVSLIGFQTSIVGLQDEELRITNAIKELQTKYFETGSISKTVYEKNFSALKSERSELLRATEVAKLRQASAERSIMHKAFSIVRGIFNTPIKYQEKIWSLLKLSTMNISKLTNLMPHKRSVPVKRFGFYDTRKGWDPEIGKRVSHATRTFMYKIGPLLLILIIGFAGFTSMNGIRLTGFATAGNPMEQALSSINEARTAVDEMQILGFGTERANDTLKEATLLYQKYNYSGSIEVALSVVALKDKAISVNNQTDEFDLQLYNVEMSGTNTSEPRTIFNEAVHAFRNEQYESSERLLQQASQKLSDIQSEEAQQRAVQRSGYDIVKFAKDNIIYILLSLAILVVLLWFIYKKLELKLTVRKLRGLEQEKEVTERMLREAQQKYFQLGNWGKSDYESAKRRYEGKIIRLNREIALLRKTIPKLSKRNISK